MLWRRATLRNGNPAALQRPISQAFDWRPWPGLSWSRSDGNLRLMIFSARVWLLPGALCALLALPASAGPAAETFAAYYRQLEHTLVSQGALRTDRGSPASDAASLVRDFVDVALTSEYAGGSLTAGAGQREAKPLLRWEDTVRMQVLFGVSVPPARREADRRAIRAYADKLARVTGHRITPAGRDANFHVLVVSEAERRSLSSQLPKLIPGISPWMVRTISRMGRNHICMVVAEPHADRRRGYARAVAIVRAESSGRLRQSCIEEELAQGMGLPNDCPMAVPSIFNDDQQYALLTRRDELLLSMLYDASLASGMTRAEAMPRITRLARRLATR